MKVYRLFKSFSENEKPRVYIHRLYDASLVLANNAFGQTYIDFTQQAQPLMLQVKLNGSMKPWINDGSAVIFFCYLDWI